MRQIGLLVFIIVSFLAITVNAMVQKGDNEFGIYGNYANFDFEGNGSEDALGAGMSVSQFVSDELSLGVHVLGVWSGDVDLYGIGGNFKHHFTNNTDMLPYLGAQLNYVYAENSGSNDGAMWGPLGGIRFFVDERTSLFVEYQYQLYEGGVGSGIDNAHGLLAGLLFKF